MRSILVAAIAAALALPATSAAATPTLFATVGPGAKIVVKTASGAPARVVPAGTYTIVVRDLSDEHNFRLGGKATGIAFTGKQVWKGVKLARGKTYTFVCDPHAGHMHGTLRVR